MNNSVVNISKKSFINVLIILSALLVVSIAITYIIPKGVFETFINSNGEIATDYDKYIPLPDASGINIFKGVFSPILVLFSKDGLSLLMLSLFLIVISGFFQIMNDVNGIKVIVRALINKFKDSKKLLIALIALIFMAFGSFLGLFEEVLTLLPLIAMVAISLGYDSFTGFIICIVATGFGFASALTNPFTVITASELLKISPTSGIWLRIIVFLIMYGLLIGYTFIHIKRIEKKPECSPTYENDKCKRVSLEDNEVIENNKTIFRTYVIFFILFIISVGLSTGFESLRGYTVVILVALFLIGSFISGMIVEKNFKKILKSFINGVVSALPAVLLVLLASSIKYILEEGQILATIAYSISNIVESKNIYDVAILMYLIILVLEFFISSSTAKAIFVMGILSCVSANISKELMVLIYLFGDGYTNVLFPTSPVLLIGLSMVGMNYLSWLNKSKWLFAINALIVIILIVFAVFIGY